MKNPPTHMAKYKLEYIWLDGYEPVPNLRGKTQIKEFSSFPKLEQLPMWGFDGSSTRQAEGRSSDCMLKPVAVYPDSTKKNGALVKEFAIGDSEIYKIQDTAEEYNRREAIRRLSARMARRFSAQLLLEY